ncbi:MAG: metallophosphoesterase [Legionella sp.]
MIRILLTIFTYFLLIGHLHATSFLTISDFHYGKNNKTGDGVDAGPILLANAFNKYHQLTKQVDFIITLGDFPTHGLVNDPRKQVYEIKIFQELYQGNSLQKPIFYVTGNNDSLLGNYQPFSFHGESPITLSQQWSGACAHCDELIIDKTHMYTDGYYSTFVMPNNHDIVLLVLNSSQFAKLAWYKPSYPNQQQDALKQLAWFEQELKRNHAKQLLIATHIPPGHSYVNSNHWQPQFLTRFIALINQYQYNYDEISILSAHTHMDDIRKIKLTDHKNIYAFATPSISRIHHNYPSMKIFKLDHAMKLKNYTTFYTASDEEWSNLDYSAKGYALSLLPECDDKIPLAQCLNAISDNDLCRRMEEGLFYGSKSPKVNGSVCHFTYPVNY